MVKQFTMHSLTEISPGGIINMQVKYFPDSDMLTIDLSDAPSSGGEDVADGIVFFYDEYDKLVTIEIDRASHRVNLKGIKADPSSIVDDSEGIMEVFTINDVAEELGVSSRAIQKTIQKMSHAGIEVGYSHARTSPILLSAAEVRKIKKWHQEHRPGRPSINSSSEKVENSAP